MSVAAVVLGPGRDPAGRSSGARRGAPATLQAVAATADKAGYDELIVLVEDEADAASLPASATVLVDHSRGGAAAALRVAIDWAQREGHDAITVALPPPQGPAGSPETNPQAWRSLLGHALKPVAVAMSPSGRSGLVRLSAEIWALAPLEGDPSLLLGSRPELVTEVSAAEGGSTDVPGTGGEDDERSVIRALLGREPAGGYRVVVRNESGGPVVIENEPFLADGTPMPTRYWLVGRRESEAVGHLEAAGGVRRASEAVAPELIEAAHARYAAERDALVAPDHRGPRPTGGVGGTRVGVKCLHAHLAWYLAGGGDPVGRWVVENLRGELVGPVAAIDCGTNSTRLLILAADGSTLERKMTITRLGEDVDRTGRLTADAIRRTVEALSAYRVLMDAHGVVAQRAAATSAARDAANSEEFFSAAAAVLGRAPELVIGEEEGRLSYRGATAGLDPADGPFVVVDLGGGSTELVVSTADPDRPASLSLDIGCVRVTERFFVNDPPLPDEIEAARKLVNEEARSALERLPELAGARRMIGVAGTVSTLVQLAVGLAEYDGPLLHHRTITRAKVEELATELLTEPVSARRERPGIEAGRADVIAAGAVIFGEIMAVLGHDEAIYSESDILDGIAAELLAAT